MVIFVAGVHGVGKTYLCQQFVSRYPDFVHASASQLIKEQMAIPNWGVDKLVADVDKNQVALVDAVRRRTDAGEKLILDGHFALRNQQREIVPLKAEVYAGIQVTGFILLEAPTDLILSRINGRDGRDADAHETEELALAGRKNAAFVSDQLRTPLRILTTPDIDTFSASILELADQNKNC